MSSNGSPLKRIGVAARRKPEPWRVLLGAVLLCGLAAAGVFALQTVREARIRAAEPGLPALAPPGALLSIESPDFAALLRQWNNSPEQRAWLASDSYSVFARSRLFGRLNDAQEEFARVSGVPADKLLPQVAGAQSLFAWYDVGNLQFLYITRMAPGQAEANDLLRSRARFSQRSAGGVAFFVRTTEDTAAGTHRTVAFATSGDLLLLSTREDLMAGALERLGQARLGQARLAQASLAQAGAGVPSAGQNATPAPVASLASEPWFTEASAALPTAPEGAGAPVLHMVLNLRRIVPMPYFRSYWIQQNMTDLAHFRASAADLYEDGADLREERALLPADASESAPAISGGGAGGAVEPDLNGLAALPPATGVFRASVTSSPGEVVEALAEKLLGRGSDPATASTLAADPTLSVTQAGSDPDAPESGSSANVAPSASDLEVRIDTPPLASASSSDEPLRAVLRASGLSAMLTWSAAGKALGPASATDSRLWIPIQSAVVLRGNSAWNPQTVEQALQASLRGALTTGTLGIDFRAEPGGSGIVALTGPKPLLFAVRDSSAGHLLLLANARAPLDAMLRLIDAPDRVPDRAPNPAPDRARHPAPGRVTAGNPVLPGAEIIAAFNHAAARGPYARLTSLIDGTNAGSNRPGPGAERGDNRGDGLVDNPGGSTAEGGSGTPPALFSQNLRSLSDSFATVAGERFVQRRVSTASGPVVRQTVTYRWQGDAVAGSASR